ncbi:MAG: NAD(P)/FAD-dependent oxidoreductase [Bacteroidota bacterium]
MKKKKVIVVGGGFAGIQLIKRLDKNLFDVLLIDKLNHHQFQPLFYQVATSQIEPASISFPLRHIVKSEKNVQVRMAEVITVNQTKNNISTSIGELEYDYLAIAIGCKTNFFGNTEIEEHALTLKTTYDAIKIRNHILQTFERVISLPENNRILNLVIVGAGPTGVELAGAFAEIKKNILPKDYPGIDFSKFNIILIEGSKSTLNSMSKTASTASMGYLAEMGVSIITETFVNSYNGSEVILSNGRVISTNSVIWAAGVVGNQINGFPESSFVSGKRFIVNRINKVIDCDNIFAIGDIASMVTPKYEKGHPQVANVAITQANLLAKNLKALVLNKPMFDYEYRDLGSMATIGNNKAVVDLPFLKFAGHLAWFIWMFLHLMLILTIRNKIVIFFNWAWKFITKDTSLRLILTQP